MIGAEDGPIDQPQAIELMHAIFSAESQELAKKETAEGGYMFGCALAAKKGLMQVWYHCAGIG